MLLVLAGRSMDHVAAPPVRPEAPSRNARARNPTPGGPATPTPVLALADLGKIELAARDLALHTLTLPLAHDDGSPLAGEEVRLWHLASGRGLLLRELDEGRSVCRGLPQGEYRIEVFGPLGARDLGRTWIEGDVELTPVSFAAPGFLRLELGTTAGEELATPLTLWSALPDVYALLEERAELASSGRVLGAGEYVLAPGPSPDAESAVAVSVASHASALVVLDGPRRPRAGEGTGPAPTSCSTCLD